MKTRVYIDGYNFYYGCLKNTPYKWLDLAVLFKQNILPRSGISNSYLHPDYGVKFYTAEISSRAAEDSSSVNDQRSYHAALVSHQPNLIQVKVVKGSYAIDKVDSRVVELNDDGTEKAPKNCSRIKTWKLEEKQSDVNVAIEAVYDAFSDPTLEHIVFVTNDTDIVPALSKLKELNALGIRKPIKIGLVVPSKERTGPRKTNKSLSQLADWTIHFVTDDELEKSQLPCRVVGGRKPSFRPLSWFRYPKEIAEILEILSDIEVCGSVPKAWRWLTETKPQVKDLPILADVPSEMLHTMEGIKAVLQHAKAYSIFKKGQG